MAGISGFFNKIRFAWISLISSIKSFFSGSNHKSSADEQYANSNNYEDSNIEEIHDENTLENEQKEVWHDALEELEESELDEEEYFDAVEDFDEQQSKEYEKNKYYNLQDGLQEKAELDNTSQTLALAFEIDELIPGSCNTDLSNLKLFAINKVDHGYALFLEDDQKNCVTLRSERLNMYFPQYFKQCGEKSYSELFLPKENRISNDIIIPLKVPREANILTEHFYNPIKAIIQSLIPNYPAPVCFRDCENRVNFYLNLEHNTLSLSISKRVSKLSCTPTETNWPIKDILLSGDFANTINKHIREQHEEEKVNSGLEYVGNITKVEAPTIHKS